MKKRLMDHRLKQFSDSPERLAWAEAHLSDQASARAVLDAADDSPYGLGQWVDAFILLGQWLEARGRRATLADQLGYVGCACEAAGSGAQLTTLPATVREMLDEYGFDCATEE